MNYLRLAFFFCFVATHIGVFGQEEKQQSSDSTFVTVKNGHFVRDGQPYYFVGMNYWYGAVLASEYGDRGRLKRELDHLSRLGINNLRVLVGADGSEGQSVVKPPLQKSQGEYDPVMLEGIDYLLAELGKRDMTAVLYLTNNWIWSGGLSQYLSWNTNTEVPNPFLPEHEWQDYMQYTSQFHTCGPCKDALNQHISFIMTRTNALTGIPYTEDPTIMSWQVANEPRAIKGSRSRGQSCRSRCHLLKCV